MLSKCSLFQDEGWQDDVRTMMPMAPRARLAFRLVGAVGTSSTFCESSACMLATWHHQTDRVT
jgi:hypothetical protein